MPDQQAPARPPTVVIAANDSWNIVNYRAGLVGALQAVGYRVAVIAPEGSQSGAVSALGVDFHPLPMSPRGTSPIADLRLLLGFRRLIREIRPAAFLGFTAKPNIYGSIAARRCGVPVINNISGLGAVFTRESLLTWLVALLYRVALRGSSTVFFQNPDDLELFVEKGLVTRDQAALLPGSGVDLEHFAPREGAKPEGTVTFLLAARLLWDKGVREFVEAARRLRATHPHARFRILGMVEPESSAAVPASQLERWHSEGVIDYLGASTDVRPAFAVADCVVLPSYYREGVPRVLLEASAMAIAVITTDAPGCREAVDDGVSGFLCEPRSADSLAAAIERIVAMPADQLHAMGAAGRKKMQAKFREDIIHRAYIDALGKLQLATS